MSISELRSKGAEKRMITPIRAMTINQLIERQDDLLISVDDLKKVVSEERTKTIDEFAQNLKLKTHMENRLIDIIAEKMKGVKND